MQQTKLEIIEDIEDITFSIQVESDEDTSVPKNHYVNNKELQKEFLIYYDMKKVWLEQGKEGHPPLTDKIGKAILDISHRRTFSHNFIAYTNNWKEEMISDAIEICCRYVHNYNPEKYNNPFAYITKLVNNAIINRIKLEKKQTYIKYKMFDMKGGYDAYVDEGNDEVFEDILQATSMYSDYLGYISDYEEKLKKPPKEEPLGILEFLGD